MERKGNPKYRSLEELMDTPRNSIIGGLSFTDCLPGFPNRTLPQRIAWRVLYHPLLRWVAAAEAQETKTNPPKENID